MYSEYEELTQEEIELMEELGLMEDDQVQELLETLEEEGF